MLPKNLQMQMQDFDQLKYYWHLDKLSFCRDEFDQWCKFDQVNLVQVRSFLQIQHALWRPSFLLNRGRKLSNLKQNLMQQNLQQSTSIFRRKKYQLWPVELLCMKHKVQMFLPFSRLRLLFSCANSCCSHHSKRWSVNFNFFEESK